MTAQPLVRVVLGMRGYGKTTLARQLTAAAPRLIGHDPDDEYDALSLPWDDWTAYVERMRWDRFRVTCPDAAVAHAEELGAWIYALGELLNPREGTQHGEVTVLLEECDQLARPGQEPMVYRKLVSYGRHHGLGIVAVSRRTAEVSRYLTSQASALYVFRTQEPREVDYLRKFIGVEATATVQGLGRFEYVLWTPEGWERKQLAGRG